MGTDIKLSVYSILIYGDWGPRTHLLKFLFSPHAELTVKVDLGTGKLVGISPITVDGT